MLVSCCGMFVGVLYVGALFVVWCALCVACYLLSCILFVVLGCCLLFAVLFAICCVLFVCVVLLLVDGCLSGVVRG